MPTEAWQEIPDDVLALEKAQQAAEAWAADQRARLADGWAGAHTAALDAIGDQWRQDSAARGAASGATAAVTTSPSSRPSSAARPPACATSATS